MDAAQQFDDFVAEHQRALLKFAMVLTGDARQAEEIVADVLGRAFEQWPRISAVERPHAYVRKMVVNEHLSWRRRLRYSTPVADVPEQSEPDSTDGHADREALIQRLARLPHKQRAALVLRFYEGLTDAEIARMLGCSESTVRSNASRALAALRIERGPTSRLNLLTKEV